MTNDSTAEHLRAELKSLADALEDVLNSSTDKPKAELENCAPAPMTRCTTAVNA